MAEVTLSQRMSSLRDALQTACPSRIVTRSFADFADRESEHLAAGIYTVMSQGEGEYQNLNGRAARDGVQRIVLSQQIELTEQDSGEDIEEAEFAMIEEVKAFMRALPASLCCLEMTGFQQSGQLDRPYGWVLVNLEWRE